MSDEEELLNNAATAAESPISKAMAAHLDSLMEGDEADDFDLPAHIAFDLGPEADVEPEDTEMHEKEVDDQAVAEATAPAFQPIDIPISFSTKGGGAWDDRELVSAFDAAKEEFHLHNPGPGSWLDKTTAALAMGKPLVGAQYGESKWYASYDPAEDPALPSHHLAASTLTNTNGNVQKEGSKSKAAKKRKRNAEAANANRAGPSNGISNQGKKVRINAPNPYIDTNPFMRSTPGSPAYSRVSPPYYPDSPPSPIYVPVSPTYTPGSPAFAPASPVYTPASPASPPTNQNEAQNKRIDPSARSEQGAERVMMGPDIPDQQRGRRLPNYAALASPSPPRNRQAPIVNHHQQHLPSHNGSRPSGSNLNPAQQRGRQDPTYEASTSGVYPSMGLSGFTSSTEMNREVAMSRAVNAQWWAGYWFAMSEVLPPAEE